MRGKTDGSLADGAGVGPGVIWSWSTRAKARRARDADGYGDRQAAGRSAIRTLMLAADEAIVPSFRSWV